MIAWLAVNGNAGDKAAGQNYVPPAECLARNGTIFQSKCYVIPPDRLPAPYAGKYCAAQGGSLVSIWSSEENDVVLQGFRQLDPTGTYHWIGLDNSVGGDWTWVELRRDPSYINWNTGEPLASVANGNGIYDSCAAMNTVGTWESRNCSNAYSFTCKFALATPPSVPRNVTAVADIARGATVSWQPPSNDGGRPIFHYQIFDQTGKAVGPAPNNSFTQAQVRNLIEDANYTFTVRAINEIGISAESDPSNIVIALPDRPAPFVPIQCYAGDGYIQISYTPGDDGGRPILTWDVKSSQGDDTTFIQYAESFVVSANNNQALSWKLEVANIVGSTTYQCPNNPLTPSASALGLPVNVASSTVFRGADVTWIAPASGIAPTGYKVRAEIVNDTTGSSQIFTTAGTSFSFVNVLTTGVTYRISVAACTGTTVGVMCMTHLLCSLCPERPIRPSMRTLLLSAGKSL